jgi:tRNA pseudouridine55 synthase
MFGLLNVHKPAGLTSRRVVDRIQRFVRPAKIGHAGTLDPLATGVLVVCLGPATRLISYVQQQPKRYQATFLLGRTSPTEDTEGPIDEIPDAPRPSHADLLAAAAQLQGRIEQRPPAFSALKVAGRRAYALARAGEEVDLAPRPITIHRLEVTGYEYPELRLEIECSSGTYVRSLGRDLAERLGTGAVMSALVRTAIGPFSLAAAVRLDALMAETIGAALLDPLVAVAHLARLRLKAEEVARLFEGRAIPDPLAGQRGDSRDARSLVAEIAALDPSGRLVALLEPTGAGELRPTRCFLSG